MVETRGGARKGAGRKKVGDGVLYCKMPQTAVLEIKRRASEKNMAVGNYIMNILKLDEND